LRKTGRMDIWDRDGVGRIWMTACQMWGRRGNREQGCGVLGLAMRGNGKGWVWRIGEYIEAFPRFGSSSSRNILTMEKKLPPKTCRSRLGTGG